VKRVKLVLLAACLAVVLPGCGDQGLPVTGSVTLGDQPLAAAVVAFEPEAGSGTTGAGAVVNVKDGQFQVDPKRAVKPGKYLVRVSPMPPGSGDDLRTAPPQFQPWETHVELKSGEGPLNLQVPASQKK
jgi:hypothetical protein